MNEEYPSNSDRAREQQPDPPLVNVTVRQSSPWRRFFNDILYGSGGNLMSNVVVPNFNRALYDIGVNVLDRVFHQRSGGSGSFGITTSYRTSASVLPSSATVPAQNRIAPVSQAPTIAKPFEFKNYAFNSRADAEVVLHSMIDILSRFNMVSVANFYDLIGVTANYTYEKYGWKDLTGARTEYIGDGQYMILWPKTVIL